MAAIFRSTLLQAGIVLAILIGFGSNATDESCEFDEQQPTVWLGDEDDDFYCKADIVNCTHFGLDYVCEDADGGSLAPCVNGTKVKCASPPAIPLADPTPATEFRVLAYNVYELRFLYWQNGQRERTCRTLHTVFDMHPDLDAIVFNEVFMGGCFAPFNDSVGTSVLTIRDILDQHGFHYYTNTVGVGFLQFPQVENGGAFIASRWPIVKNASHVFNSTEFYEFMAKGVVYAMIDKTVNGVSMSYHVFGTHMQAFRTAEADSVRVDQAGEIRRFMQMQGIGEDHPVIYAGDMNARLNTTNGDDVIQALDATLPHNVGKLNVTYDPVNNDIFDANNGTSWWIDYVLYSNAHVRPIASSIQVVRPLADRPIEICSQDVSLNMQPLYPDSETCRETKNITDLSDHYAVLGIFRFPSPTSVISTHAPSTLMSTEGSSGARLRLSIWSVCMMFVICLFFSM